MGPIQNTYIDCIVNYSIMCIWKELMLWRVRPCENCLKVMWVFWVDLGPPMGVSATCGCVRNLQNIWYMQAQWEVNTTQFQWSHTWPPRGLWTSTWPPRGHMPVHRGTHCGWGQTSQLLIGSHGPILFWDTASPSLMLHLAGIQSTVNANGWQDGCFTG